MRPHRGTAATILVALLVACTPAADDGEAAPPDTGPRDASTPTAPAEPSAPDTEAGASDPLLAFTGRQLDGGTFDGSAVTGDVIVWFWTPW